MTLTVKGPSRLRESGHAINKKGNTLFYQHKEFRLKQEARGDHRSPEKPVLVQSYDYIITLIRRGEKIKPKQTKERRKPAINSFYYN